MIIKINLKITSFLLYSNKTSISFVCSTLIFSFNLFKNASTLLGFSAQSVFKQYSEKVL